MHSSIPFVCYFIYTSIPFPFLYLLGWCSFQYRKTVKKCHSEEMISWFFCSRTCSAECSTVPTAWACCRTLDTWPSTSDTSVSQPQEALSGIRTPSCCSLLRWAPRDRKNAYRFTKLGRWMSDFRTCNGAIFCEIHVWCNVYLFSFFFVCVCSLLTSVLI